MNTTFHCFFGFSKTKLWRQIACIHYWRGRNRLLKKFPFRSACLLSSVFLLVSTGNIYLSRRTRQQDLWEFFAFQFLKNSTDSSWDEPSHVLMPIWWKCWQEAAAATLKRCSDGGFVRPGCMFLHNKGFSLLHAGLCQGFIFHKVCVLTLTPIGNRLDKNRLRLLPPFAPSKPAIYEALRGWFT